MFRYLTYNIKALLEHIMPFWFITITKMSTPLSLPMIMEGDLTGRIWEKDELTKWHLKLPVKGSMWANVIGDVFTVITVSNLRRNSYTPWPATVIYRNHIGHTMSMPLYIWYGDMTTHMGNCCVICRATYGPCGKSSY